MTDGVAPRSGFDAAALAPRRSRRYLMVRRVVRMGLVAVLVVGVCIGLLFTRLFGVDRVEVTGTSHVQPDQIRSAAAIRKGQPLVKVDGGAVSDRVRRNAWIASVAVERQWPHGIKVAVVERRAVAVVQANDHHWATVGDDGVVVEVGDARALGLPAMLDVTGTDRAGTKVDDKVVPMVHVAGSLPDSLRPKVTQIGMADGVLRLGLDSGTVVILGSADDMADKLTAAAAVLSHADPSKLATLDVTSPHMPTSTEKGATSTSTAHGQGTSGGRTGASGNSGGTSSPSINGQGSTTTTQKSGKASTSSTSTSTPRTATSTTTTSVAPGQ
jgi:cell division protein FtsQ